MLAKSPISYSLPFSGGLIRNKNQEGDCKNWESNRIVNARRTPRFAEPPPPDACGGPKSKEPPPFTHSSLHRQVLVDLILRLVEGFIRALREPVKHLLLVLRHHLA